MNENALLKVVGTCLGGIVIAKWMHWKERKKRQARSQQRDL